MITHAKNGIIKKKKKKAFLSHIPAEPSTFAQVAKDIHWTQAMQKEFDALLINNTW